MTTATERTTQTGEISQGPTSKERTSGNQQLLMEESYFYL